MKFCNTCKTLKPLDNFSKKGKYISSSCKDCLKMTQRKYRRTKDGLINTIYQNQKKASKKRNMGPPQYTQPELKNWLFSQKKFHILFNSRIYNFKRV